MHGNTVGSRESLTKSQNDILIGKILGDGCLERNGINVRLKIEQGDKQREYVNWLYDQFKPHVGRPPRALFHSGISGIKTKRWRFSTLTKSFLNPYQTLFYKESRKVISSKIVSLINTPLILAVWYMDDGYMRTDKTGIYLCTSSFSLREHKLLQQALTKNFEIDSSIHYAGEYPRIYIPSRSRDDFLGIIQPYVLGLFRYKLSLTP